MTQSNLKYLKEGDFLNVAQAAVYLQINEKTLYRLIRRQGMPALKLGREWRFKKSLLDEWLMQRMKEESRQPDWIRDLLKEMKKIAPSVLSADFCRLGDEIRAVEAAGADLIHLDIMDGHFVPNITAGPILVEAARRVTKLPLDAHLMIENPEKYIPDFAAAGADSITIHIEACPRPRDLRRALELIRKKGAKPSLSLNPPTTLSKVLPFLEEVEMILVMTVNPGFGGQGFIPSCLKKVESLRRILDEKGLKVAIEVDGGIKVDNIGEVSRAGGDIFVAGSAIFKSADYRKTIQEMRQRI